MPTKVVDGVRVQTTPADDAQKAADEAEWLAAIDLPQTYVLSRHKWLELLYEGTRESELETYLAGVTPPGKAIGFRAYLNAAGAINWNHPAIVGYRAVLTEGEAAFSAAWVAKGQE